MRQTFEVTAPAADRSLLTTAQLRAAAGLAPDDDTRDAELAELGLRVADEIALACNVASDGVHIPTLLRETVTETFWFDCREDDIFLSRRFIASMGELSECGTALAPSDYVVFREAGMLRRSSGGRPWAWALGTISVTYVAGLDPIPADLAGTAMDLMRLRLSAAVVDPLEKSRTVEIPDVETVRVDRWVGTTPGQAGVVPADIQARLARYMNVAIA